MLTGNFDLKSIGSHVPDSQYVRDAIFAISALCPRFRVLEYGSSLMGKPLLALCAGRGGRRVFFSAAHHANEWLTSLVLLRFLAELCEKSKVGGKICGFSAQKLLQSGTLCFAPLVNPDGLDLAVGVLDQGEHFEAAKKIAANYPEIPFPQGWKANIAGTDLNLQYPAGWERAREIKFAAGFTAPAPRDFVGEAPLDATEAKGLFALTRRLSPDVIVALHSQGETIYWKFADFEPYGSRELGRRLARASGYALEETPSESGWAGYKDWFIQSFNRPGYTVELGLGENPLPLADFEDVYAKMCPLLVRAVQG
ncbi:MAG: M14 family metallocarboxypeptidase [Oscillospiraceae bacterium]